MSYLVMAVWGKVRADNSATAVPGVASDVAEVQR